MLARCWTTLAGKWARGAKVWNRPRRVLNAAVCDDTSSVIVGAEEWQGVRSIRRLLRGGGWNNNSRNCRSANRNNNQPTNRNTNNGFRVVVVSCGVGGQDSTREAI